MSSAPFPERIDAVKLFARMGSITAELPLARLQRFTDQLAADSRQGQVKVDMHFGRDEEGRRRLSATLDTRVQVACQRCLQDMDLDLNCELSLLVLDSEDAVKALPEDQDGVVMDEDGLDVVALIEDELILSLPMIPVHADTGCNRVLNALKQDEEAEERRPKPFGILASLKRGGAETRAKPPGKKAKPGKRD